MSEGKTYFPIPKLLGQMSKEERDKYSSALADFILSELIANQNKIEIVTPQG
jgi:hypothetical protein